MKPHTLLHEDAKSYTLHDGKAPFRVPKAGLSDALHAKIRAMTPQKMAGGGDVELDAGAVARPEYGPPAAAPQDTPETIDRRKATAFQMPAALDTVPVTDAGGNWEVAPPPEDPGASGAGMLARPADMPQEAPTAAQVAKVAPNTPVKPAARPLDTYGQEKALVKQQGETAAAKGEEDAGYLAGLQKDLQANAAKQAQTRALAESDAAERMAKYDAAVEQMKSMDATVDPGRWWASRSTPGKILGAIGLALGAIGAGNDGVNRAVGIIDNAINRDMDAQKSTIEARMHQAQAGIQAAHNAVSLQREIFNDKLAGDAAAKASLLDLASNQLRATAAKYSSPEARQQSQMLGLQIDQKRDAAIAAAHQQAQKNALAEREMQVKEAEARAKLMEAGDKTATEHFAGTGEEVAPGAHPNPKQLEAYVEKRISHTKMASAADQLSDLIEKSGTTELLTGEKAGQAQSLAAALIPAILASEGLKRLSGEDIKLFRHIDADPTTVAGMLPAVRKRMLSAINTYMANQDEDLRETRKVLGVRKAQQAAPARAAPAAESPGQVYVGPGGMKIRRGPTGEWERVS